jgi:uncharacterized protein with HEPN domain
MQEQIRDLDRLLDIQEFSAFVLKYRPSDERELTENKLLQLGILKALENIGEAANQVSKETQSEFNQVDWKGMIAARHVYAHHYFKIDWEKIWESINTINFEELIEDAEEIINILKKRFSL